MLVLVLVVRASRRCAVCDSVVVSGVVADGAEKTGQKSCFRRTMDPAGACCCRGGVPVRSKRLNLKAAQALTGKLKRR